MLRNARPSSGVFASRRPSRSSSRSKRGDHDSSSTCGSAEPAGDTSARAGAGVGDPCAARVAAVGASASAVGAPVGAVPHFAGVSLTTPVPAPASAASKGSGAVALSAGGRGRLRRGLRSLSFLPASAEAALRAPVRARVRDATAGWPCSVEDFARSGAPGVRPHPAGPRAPTHEAASWPRRACRRGRRRREEHRARECPATPRTSRGRTRRRWWPRRCTRALSRVGARSDRTPADLFHRASRTHATTCERRRYSTISIRCGPGSDRATPRRATSSSAVVTRPDGTPIPEAMATKSSSGGSSSTIDRAFGPGSVTPAR